jgi:hypothetical protein
MRSGLTSVDVGPLSGSLRFQPGTLAYCHNYDALTLGAVKWSRLPGYREDADSFGAELVRLFGSSAGAA